MDLLELELLNTVQYQPHLMSVRRYEKNNDMLQEYSNHLANVTLNTKRIFKKFIENKLYDINYQNQDGNTLLHILIIMNQNQLIVDILKWSLENNKPILFLTNQKTQTVLHFCCYLQNTSILNELVNYLHKTKQTLELLDSPDNHNRTPISISIKQRNEKMLDILLKNGANPNSFIDEKYIPLHYAIQKRFKKGILLLIKYGAQKFTPTYLQKSLIEKTKSRFAINLLDS